MTFENFISAIPHKFSEAEIKLLQDAFKFAIIAHEGQVRASKHPYFTHPASAAIILGQIFPDPTSIAATLLHDIPEDTTYTLTHIQENFGDKIAELVGGVTKLGHVRMDTEYQPQYLENLRKLFVATSKDVRVMLIKLADRLHNMRTINFLPQEKQKRIALETLEIYAPIAARLGIGAWQGELEDLSFKIVDPKRWQYVNSLHQELTSANQATLEDIKIQITLAMESYGINNHTVSGRMKRVYSLHKKLNKPAYKDANHTVADILAFRIITDSIANCYATLGIIHQEFEPVVGTFDDYITLPKPSGYQSLHTTVIDKNNNKFEVQIRTDLMHEQAERGVAAHWFYTASGKQSKKVSTDHSWTKELRSWQDHAGSPTELLENLKLDLFSDRIFVRTPHGDVINLPTGATPIDFAFSIHGDLGTHLAGAKANGKMISIYDELEQGDMVEILKSKNPVKISRDWLLAAKTHTARSRIRKYLSESVK